MFNFGFISAICGDVTVLNCSQFLVRTLFFFLSVATRWRWLTTCVVVLCLSNQRYTTLPGYFRMRSHNELWPRPVARTIRQDGICFPLWSLNEARRLHPLWILSSWPSRMRSSNTKLPKVSSLITKFEKFEIGKGTSLFWRWKLIFYFSNRSANESNAWL